ncbi:hypothetical protein [Aquimarina sp. Aq107]|uniref:hypothetical protein n=1 Tax=Aquimarina sp. Aq107 TaxID=1191912 RepID=UPI000D5529BE|nr:hypothetical protein [Aquimarina sp. Aq107]
MNSPKNKYLLSILVCSLTIGIYAQEKVTEEAFFSNKKSSSEKSKMPIYKPNYKLDEQIKNTLINDTDPIMPIYKPYLSLEFKSKNPLAKVSLKTLEEIKKSLRNN